MNGRTIKNRFGCSAVLQSLIVFALVWLSRPLAAQPVPNFPAAHWQNVE